MKAVLKFKLPEDEDEFKHALAGTDSLLVIHDVLSEIRSFLKYGSGYFKDYEVDPLTLERVMDYIYMIKGEKKLPDLN